MLLDSWHAVSMLLASSLFISCSMLSHQARDAVDPPGEENHRRISLAV